MTTKAYSPTRLYAEPGMPSLRLWFYSAIFALPLLIASAIGGGLYYFLHRTGETMSAISAAHRQGETGEKYGAALVYRPYAFKLERYRMIRPDILLVGSSRVMAFPGEALSETVYNAGGAANNIDQAAAFIEAALAIHRPKSILLGLDFWWFNPNRDDGIDTSMQNADEIEISLSELVAPIEWVVSDRISVSELISAILPWNDRLPGIGALAQFRQQGWDRFGRFDYGELYDGRMKSADPKFSRTIERLSRAKSSSKFSVSVGPAAEAIATMERIVETAHAEGVEIVLLLPPIAPPVLAQLTNDPEDILIPGWEQAVRSMGAPTIDVQDAMELGSTECEFIDGFHAGEVAYLRIFQQVAGMKDVRLSAAIDRQAVDSMVAGNAGRARIDELRAAGVAPEIDFLALGCSKS